MSDTTPGRRWLGRGLIAAGAFALPLTASVSFAADEQEVPAPPAPPAPPFPVAAPSAIEAPLAPDAPEAALPPEAAEPGVQRFVLRRGGPGEAGTQVRQFVLRGDGEHPFPAPPHIEWRALGNPDDPAFQAQMEQWRADMEKWRAEWEEKWGPEQRAQALALAETARRNAPVVINSCDEGDEGVTRSTTDDGRQRIVICQRQILADARQALQGARSGLRIARETIARNREISDEVRREVLQDLDREIERIEREDD